MIEGFTYSEMEVGPTRYRLGLRGKGPPVLLLHGFPQTHYCWRDIAPGLADGRTVVVCDLKGYGESRSEPGRELGEGYSNRERSAELVELMSRLGLDRFAVVGHDRGGRVAYRMGLDHPESVDRLCVLNIILTVDQFERMAEGASLGYWPWYFLAQPPPFAERVIAASAEYVLRDVLRYWPASPEAIPEEAVQIYLEGFNEVTIPGMCADYRASFHIDRQTDAEDRDARRRIRCPVLVHWGSEETALADALEVWRAWADDVKGGPLPSGHFIPEEASEELATSLGRFLISSSD